MKFSRSIILFFFLLIVTTLSSAQTSPKKEFRGAWITTVWAIDWPKPWGDASASGKQQQQASLISIINTCHEAGMNACFLQVRGMSDAMYRSSFPEEPWSKYLTGTRGGDPGYDPLQLAITTAHDRGMELYAWINPYRYASSSDTYGNLPTDYINTHPDWIMHGEDGGKSILNPGIPEVETRICEIIADILNHYDVDGIVFDDYFYQVTATVEDSAQYNAYRRRTANPMALADWRRANVNHMIHRVNDTIKALKPWVDFCIGPAGVAATNAAVAASHGVDKCPVGSDWQYNDICSDPLAWYEEHSIDVMAPQLYWKIGATTDYAKLDEWWLKVASHFGRYCWPASSQSNQGIGDYAAQVRLNRQLDQCDAPGTSMYSLSNGISQNMATYLPANVFYHPALPPEKVWIQHQREADIRVTNITKISTNKLHWVKPKSNLRYAVYQVPTDSIYAPGIFYKSDYLLGITYTNEFTVTDRAGYTYAVSVLDRSDNEYPPVTMGNSTIRTLAAPELVFPENNSTPLLPANFVWRSVPNASSYYWQVSESQSFDSLVYQYEVMDTTFFSGKITSMKEGVQYYWRIKARGANARDVYSAVYSYTGSFFGMVTPEHNATDQVLENLELICDSVPYANVQYIFEVAKNAGFGTTTVFVDTVTAPRTIIPAGVLTFSTNYYVRVKAMYGNMSTQSATTSFRTMAVPVPAPVIISPRDGETIYGNEVRVVWQAQDALSYKIELSKKTNFAGRETKTGTAPADATEYTFTNVTPNTYYLRMKASSENGLVTADYITIYVEEATGVDNTQQSSPICLINNTLLAPVGQSIELYNAAGQLLSSFVTTSEQTLLPALPQGVYLIRAGEAVFKFQR